MIGDKCRPVATAQGMQVSWYDLLLTRPVSFRCVQWFMTSAMLLCPRENKYLYLTILSDVFAIQCLMVSGKSWLDHCWMQGCARLMSRESNLTRLWLKWVESESSRPWKSRIWVESESNHADCHLSQSWVNWILLESKLSHWFFEEKTSRSCNYL